MLGLLGFKNGARDRVSCGTSSSFLVPSSVDFSSRFNGIGLPRITVNPKPYLLQHDKPQILQPEVPQTHINAKEEQNTSTPLFGCPTGDFKTNLCRSFTYF